MKIAIVCRGLSTGGSGKIAANIANHFAAMGHKIYYIAVFYPRIDYPLDKRVTYSYINPPKKYKGIPGLKKNLMIYRFLKREQPEIIISFVTRPMMLSCVLLNIPMIFSPRNDPHIVDNDFVTHHIRNLEYRKAKRIVFQTIGAKQYFPRDIQKKGIIIANPVPPNIPKWDRSKTENYIVSTCRIEPQKDIPTMLRAFQKFHFTHSNYLLKICGVGEDMNKMKSLCRELGIEDNVIFMGFCTNVYDIVVHAKMFVLTSKYEGLSNSMLEALAIGVPTICTDCPPGGAAVYIKDHVNGILIPVGDDEALYRSFCELADSPEIDERMSKEAVKIRKELDYESIMHKWDNVISDVVM